MCVGGRSPLVEHDEEDDVVAEAAEAVHGGHLDDEGKHCAHVCIELTRQVGMRLHEQDREQLAREFDWL